MMAGYIPLPEAAAYLGRSARWVRRRVARGELRFYRPPESQLSFTREDLDNFMTQYVHEPTKPVKPAARPDLDDILADIDMTPRRRRGKKR